MSNNFIKFFLIVLFFSVTTSAQIPDEFTNLKVFPEDISKKDLVDAMKNFTGALGVRCNYCHDKKADVEQIQSLADFDFASDKIPAKDITRVMMKMTGNINGDFLSQISEHSKPARINCETCHKGLPAPPANLEDILFKEISKNGVEAGVNKYKELREKHYGGFVYDFTFNSLSPLSEQLVSAGNSNYAVEFFNSYIKNNYENSWNAYLEIANIYRDEKKYAEAETNYKKALELSPENKIVLMNYNKMKEDMNKK